MPAIVIEGTFILDDILSPLSPPTVRGLPRLSCSHAFSECLLSSP